MKLPALPALLGILLLWACNPTDAEKATSLVAQEPVQPTPVKIPNTDSLSIQAFVQEYPLLSEQEIYLHRFYRKHQYTWVWFNEDGVLPQAGYFLNLLQQMSGEGIRDTMAYLARTQLLYTTIQAQGAQALSDSSTLDLELLLSAQFFQYAGRVWSGLREEKTQSLSWFIQRNQIIYEDLLDTLLLRGPDVFAGKKVVYEPYYLMRDARLAWHTKADTTWNNLVLPEETRYLTLGDTGLLTRQLQERLQFWGDLDTPYSAGVIDSATFLAIQRFQWRHGLSQDGKAGSQFLKHLNTSPAGRMEQLEVNMERCRWVPFAQKGNYLMVNIPAFELYIYEKDSIIKSMPIIVGTTAHATIVFNDELEYVVFSPYWVITPNIIKNEIIPAILNNPKYLEQHEMEVYQPSTGKVLDAAAIDWNTYKNRSFPYGIRQKPGARNALGWVKFLFPNTYYIYLHDTSNRDLFSRTQRSFSHGCIRVSEPEWLAAYLLRNDSTWTTQKLQQTMYGGKETYVTLPEKVPVFIAYFTAWADNNGVLHFRDDIYGHDQPLLDALNQTPATVSK